jgi:hypothetical protein
MLDRAVRERREAVERLERVREYVQNNFDVWYDTAEPRDKAEQLARAYADIYQKVLNVIDTGDPMRSRDD